ncbi:class I SAM-dependent methyltransferase [Mycolicibacterium sp. 120266]|uniref:class I SAM-dependent methyltransferase n=1 Tax=Mycolicibacterium sp. 120266 TaxID=3090601 RepID=UPI00299D28D8|nr:class I SAM-dependent methyltransferase [Mycolicibacterium sp. 120266]MDX1875382.1 class I SAM-dependent methyltransferase [Mycolicibacterium sp. 120266]
MTQLVTVGSSRAWLRIMALLYDPFLWSAEIAGMRRRRRNLLAQAHGRVLEIGAGTGLNIAHYPADLDELLLTEPEAGMRRKLAHRLDRSGRRAVISDARAECLPWDSVTVDTVVATLVLCTVDDPARALREIARVLRPGGQLLLIEHTRSSWRPLMLWQNLFERPWRAFAGGCVCNRPTLDLIRAAGFEVDATDAVWSGMPFVVHPLVVGRATR